jgi:hypothetical protein
MSAEEPDLASLVEANLPNDGIPADAADAAPPDSTVTLPPNAPPPASPADAAQQAFDKMLDSTPPAVEHTPATSDAPPVDAPPADTPPADTPPPSTAARDAFAAETGIDASKYKNDTEFYKGVAEAQRTLGQRQQATAEQLELAKFAQQSIQEPGAFVSKWAAQQPEQFAAFKEQRPELFSVPEQPETPAEDAPAIPTFNSEWLQYIENGQLVDGTPAAVRKDFKNYLIAEQIADNPVFQRQQRELESLKAQLASSPDKLVDEKLVDDKVAVGIDNYAQKLAANQYAQSWVDDNKNWMLVDPNNPRAGYTPNGQKYIAYLQEAASIGIREIEHQLRYATRSLNEEIHQNMPPPKVRPNAQAGQHVADPSRPAGTGEPDHAVRDGELFADAINRQTGLTLEQQVLP